MKLDNTDLQILHLLQQDGRMTIKELSNRLNLSTTPIFERIKKLEKSGIIDRYMDIREDENETFLEAYRRVGSEPFKDALYSEIESGHAA